ncbi:MAG TPA: hypothetical protein VHO29_11015 [Marmoricola sp.]|nr:hypothetical protein [Marmoricola sp.]
MIRFVVWLLFLAAVLYAVFWAIDRRNWTRGQDTSRRPRTPPPRPRGPLGPDDDEAFLRDLERRRRREHGDPPPG